ncbi:MAG TPA: efflux RND transporter periplasmic adaptor subunit, partial [Thioalkalivibrio sp.]|nr:efflux RND transporter periplasmic adaptor subunit [Thioalkalivibrio sp.]
ERDGAPGVFLVEDDEDGPTGRFVAVGVGVQTDDWVEIRSPALEGQVVTLGHHLLSDGGRVQVVDPDELDTRGAR